MSFIFRPPVVRMVTAMVLPVRLRVPLAWMLWLVAAVFIFFVFFGYTYAAGFAFMLSAIALSWTLFVLYLSYGVFVPRVPIPLRDALARVKSGEEVNIAPYCSSSALVALRGIGSLTVESILERLLGTQRCRMILERLGLDVGEVHSALTRSREDGARVDLAQALALAALHAVRRGHHRIRLGDLLVSFGKSSASFQRHIFERGLSLDDLDVAVHWEDRLDHLRERRRRFWSRENLFAVQPFGRSWAFGYTPLLERFGIDLGFTIGFRSDVSPPTGRQTEINAVERALARAANANVLLIGEPGVGVEDVIVGFVRRVTTGSSMNFLNYRRIFSINLASVVAGARTTVEAEGSAKRLLDEAAHAGGLILVLENFDAVLGSATGGLPLDLTATLLPHLQGANLQIVATTTYQGVHEAIEKRTALASLFERVEVREPSMPRTLEMLLELTPNYERRFRMFIPFPALKAVVTYADRTIQDVPFPKKAFDVLEASLIAAAGMRAKKLLPEHVAQVISQRTEVPVGALTREEEKKLLNLEEFIHERIVNQSEAVRVVANALRRARAGLSAGLIKRPMGTFLFLGPTGVGKTETAKALAEAYFGNEERMIRLNMSEFQGFDAVDRLIGSPATREEGRLTTAVRENPFSLVLLDEFEKAEGKALNLFLQVLDEGRMEDGWGRRVSFTNTIIIATSNAGAEFIREYLKEGRDTKQLDDALREEVLRSGIFRPELVNRFDAVVVYRPLGLSEVRDIATRIVKKFSDHVYHERGARIEVEDEALSFIIKEGFNQEFGARELRRVLQNNVENIVAKKVLSGEASRGTTLTITRADFDAT